MKLGNKSSFPQREEADYKPPPDVDWTKYQIDYSAEISYGKWKGHILQRVADDDPKYFSWMRKEKLIESWGLYREKNPKKQYNHQFDPLITSRGEIWLTIYEVCIK